MSDIPFVVTETRNGLMFITIDRQEKMNALNDSVLNQLDKALDNLQMDIHARGAIITGAGEKAFVAGADIASFLKADKESGRSLSEKGQSIFNKIAYHEKPIIAAVNGYALGGGCELAMSCHFRIASTKAIFGQPEISLGIIPGYGGTQRLTQLVGKGKAMEMMMTGEQITADEAYRIGLVNQVCSPEELLTIAEKKMQVIVQKSSLALKNIIKSVHASDEEIENGFEKEAEYFGECFKSDEMTEGVTAFLEKRKPDFHKRLKD